MGENYGGGAVDLLALVLIVVGAALVLVFSLAFLWSTRSKDYG